jgi:hypothetical protein
MSGPTSGLPTTRKKRIMADTESVVFEFPNPNGGDPVLKSNDPYYNAKQVIRDRESGDSEEVAALKAQLTELQAAQAEAAGEDDGDDEADEFSTLKGADLKNKAAELGVDITGLKKVGEVRQALRDHVAAQA